MSFFFKLPFLTFLKPLLSRELNEKIVKQVFDRKILDLSSEGGHILDHSQLLLLVHKNISCCPFSFRKRRSNFSPRFSLWSLKRSKTLVLSLRSTVNVSGKGREKLSSTFTGFGNLGAVAKIQQCGY